MERDDEARLVEALTHEIEERKKTEEALRSSERRLRSYFEASMVGISITSPERGWIDLNTTFCEMLGYSEAEFRGMTWHDITHPDDMARSVVEFDRILSGEHDGYVIEKRYIHKNGRIVDTIVSAKAVRRPDGSLEYMAAFLHDITARKQAERALYASQRALARHFEQTPMGILELTTDKRICAWNPAAERIFGFTKEQILGQPASVLFPEPETTLVESGLAMLLARQGGAQDLHENVTRDGRAITCEWFTTALIDESGVVVGLSAMVQDVTLRVQVERELRAHLATIQEQEEAIQALSFPILQVWQGVLAVPVVGALDEARAAELTSRLLERISSDSARHVILDLTGANVVDTGSAEHLQRIIAAARLLGATPLVTGIRPSVAETMIASGIDLSNVITRRTLRDALHVCIQQGNRGPEDATAADKRP